MLPNPNRLRTNPVGLSRHHLCNSYLFLYSLFLSLQFEVCDSRSCRCMHAYANVDRTSPLVQIRNGVRWLTDTRSWAGWVYMTRQRGLYWYFSKAESDSGTVIACISWKQATNEN